jgi:transcriptional regulator GlxA family with amidase domain
VSDEKKITLRSKEQVQKARTGEIIRAMRDAAELKQPVDAAWVEELAELVGVDIRKR